jgi:hypothetical protein
MSPEDARLLADIIASEVDKSSSVFTLRDILLIVGLSITGFLVMSGIIVYFVYKYMIKKNSNGASAINSIILDTSLANAAHAEIMKNGADAFQTINRTDELGMPVIYSMAAAAKQIAKSVMGLDEKMTHLFNHQSNMWKDHDRDISELKRKAGIKK